MSGVGVETVRFYQRKELLREPTATGAFRTYTEEDAQRIIMNFIEVS
jgi:DNA-binding transcriptional MerR regulator